MTTISYLLSLLNNIKSSNNFSKLNNETNKLKNGIELNRFLLILQYYKSLIKINERDKLTCIKKLFDTRNPFIIELFEKIYDINLNDNERNTFFKILNYSSFLLQFDTIKDLKFQLEDDDSDDEDFNPKQSKNEILTLDDIKPILYDTIDTEIIFPSIIADKTRTKNIFLVYLEEQCLESFPFLFNRSILLKLSDLFLFLLKNKLTFHDEDELYSTIQYKFLLTSKWDFGLIEYDEDIKETNEIINLLSFSMDLLIQKIVFDVIRAFYKNKDSLIDIGVFFDINRKNAFYRQKNVESDSFYLILFEFNRFLINNRNEELKNIFFDVISNIKNEQIKKVENIKNLETKKTSLFPFVLIKFALVSIKRSIDYLEYIEQKRETEIISGFTFENLSSLDLLTNKYIYFCNEFMKTNKLPTNSNISQFSYLTSSNSNDNFLDHLTLYYDENTTIVQLPKSYSEIKPSIQSLGSSSKGIQVICLSGELLNVKNILKNTLILYIVFFEKKYMKLNFLSNSDITYILILSRTNIVMPFQLNNVINTSPLEATQAIFQASISRILNKLDIASTSDILLEIIKLNDILEIKNNEAYNFMHGLLFARWIIAWQIEIGDLSLMPILEIPLKGKLREYIINGRILFQK